MSDSTATVTVLFTDVVGSTSLRTAKGDTAAQDIMRSHFDLVRQQIQRHAGQEVKTIGDSFMVAFASARRAVECAVAVQRALNERNRAQPNDAVEVRIGLHTGEAILEDGDYFGSAVDAAARIMARAGAGQILVSEMLKGVLGSTKEVSLTDKGRVALKGFPDRWRLFEVKWEDEAAAQAPAPVSGRTEFVGRSEERATLGRLLEEARRGHGSLALVAGEAGVGKTRLAEEVVAEARSKGMFTAIGHCYETEGAPPYIAFVEVIDYATRIVSQASLLEALGDAAPEVAKLAPKLRRLVPGIAEPLDLPPEQARHYMFESVCDFLERGARVQPMVLVLDDLHWADESSCLLIEHLAQRIADMSILVVGTYRDVDLSPSTPVTRTIENLSRKRLSQRVSLRRFGEADVREMLRILGGREPPAPLVKVIHEETEGVAYFVEEVFRHLMEEGRLFEADGSWRSEVQIGEVEVPESVRLVIGRRLERVSEPTIQALTHAAAIGRDFDYDFLRALVDSSEDQLLDAIDEAESANLIRSSQGSAPRFSFWHEQIRQTLLGSLSFPRRQRLHLRVADTIEKLRDGSPEEHYGDLAYHFALAGQRERALDYIVRAGDESAKRYAITEALGYYQRALEMVPSPEQRRAVLARRAKLLLALFRGKEAAPDLEELLEVRRRDGDKAAEVDTLLDLGSAYWTVALDDPATLQKSRDALENAYTLARELGDKAKMARALLPTMWFTSFWPDYADTLRKNIEEAYALSLDVGDEDLLLDARRARFSLWRGEDAEAEGAAIRVELEKKGSLVRLNDILFSLMWLYYRQAKFALCVECCDEGTAVARRIGAKPVQYASIKGLALLDLGRFDAAWNSFQQEVADEDTPFGRAQRDLGIAAYYAEVLAFERADAAARDVIEQARKVGRPWIRAWAQTILASAALSLRGVEGDTADAIREELRRSGARLSPEVLGEALLAAGAAGEALDQAEDALAAIAATQRTREATIAFGRRAWPALLDIKARALIALERADEALPLVDEAIAFARAQDYRRVLWRLLATLGAAREALGQTEAAARAYDEAAASVAALAETIPDDRLRRGFMANPAVAAVLEAGNQSARRRR